MCYCRGRVLLFTCHGRVILCIFVYNRGKAAKWDALRAEENSGLGKERPLCRITLRIACGQCHAGTSGAGHSAGAGGVLPGMERKYLG